MFFNVRSNQSISWTYFSARPPQKGKKNLGQFTRQLTSSRQRLSTEPGRRWRSTSTTSNPSQNEKTRLIWDQDKTYKHMHSAERHASRYKKANIEIPKHFGHLKINISLNETLLSEQQQNMTSDPMIPHTISTICPNYNGNTLIGSFVSWYVLVKSQWKWNWAC